MNDIETLKQNSIEITQFGIEVIWPQDGREETIHPQETTSKFNGCYAVNNSTIAFVSNHRLFVTPYTRSAIKTLVNNGHAKSNFYVPFSNCDYPKHTPDYWRALRQAAYQEYLKDNIRDCCEWSDEHGIGSISDDLLEQALEVPDGGLPFHSPRGYDDTYYGECSCGMDCVATMRLGKFCRNNGVVAFVYRDGHTYLARGYKKIIPALTAAGYTETSFFVPLSNGETITDVALASKWESLKR